MNKKITIIIALCLLSTSWVCSKKNEMQKSMVKTNINELELNFDQNKTGNLPPEWSIEKTGNGKIGTWQIIPDTIAKKHKNVIAQLGKKSLGNHFHLAILENSWFNDVDIEMELKMVDGQEEQAGGPVWHYQDPNNYYTCLSDPLKERLRVYKVENGEKRLLQSVWASKIEPHEWERLKVIHEKGRIRCWFDNKKFIDFTDNTFTSGKVGLCTKADAIVYFDNLDFEIEN